MDVRLRSAGRWLAGLAVVVLATACGGGGGGGDEVRSPLGLDTQTRTRLSLQSESGDWVGGGSAFAYTQTDARFEVRLVAGVLEISVLGDQHWRGRFRLAGAGAFAPGTTTRLPGFDASSAERAGLSWDGNGRSCDRSEGELTVVSIAGQPLGNDQTSVNQLELRFTQRCEGYAGTLRGHLVWNRSDPTRPAGPAALPAGLWQAPEGAIPATGNHLYLHSEAGEPLGLGQTRRLSGSNSGLNVHASVSGLYVTVSGDESWSLSFSAPFGTERVSEGFYAPLRGRQLVNPARGGMAVDSDFGECSAVEGWVAIDHIRYRSDHIVELRLRFEQRCDGGTARLRGQLQWSDGAVLDSLPTGPVDPPPGDLWRAAVLPAEGNVLVLEGGPGRPGFEAQQRSFTRADSLFRVSTAGSGLTLEVLSDRDVTLRFLPMTRLAQLRPGYYGGIGPNSLPWTGTFSARVDALGCEPRDSWFVIDRLVFEGDRVRELELRFEHRCSPGGAVLRGHLRWAASNPDGLAGPVQPPPTGLWSAPAGAWPATGNAVFIDSDPDDRVAEGEDRLFTNANALIDVSVFGTSLRLRVREWDTWQVWLNGMAGLDRLRPGYYAPISNRGSTVSRVDIIRNLPHGCLDASGWFVIDRLDYLAGQLQAVEFRLEHRCQPQDTALRLHVRWSRDDTTALAGPQPPAPGLWRAPASAVPATGSYLLVDSAPGDPIGLGTRRLYTPENARLHAQLLPRGLGVLVRGDEHWDGSFVAMEGLELPLPGHYPRLRAASAASPVHGGLTWRREVISTCSGTLGWVVIDHIEVVDNQLVALEMRSEQTCGGGATLFRTQMRWRADDPGTSAGPVQPPPAGLWQTPAGVFPATGNAFYAEGDSGESLTRGLAQLITGAGQTVSVSPTSEGLEFVVDEWRGSFRPMYWMAKLQPGHYPGLGPITFHNPARGALSWRRTDRNCPAVLGPGPQSWVVIDDVRHGETGIEHVDLRFAFVCAGTDRFMRGRLRWTFSSPSVLAAPRARALGAPPGLLTPSGRLKPAVIPVPAPSAAGPASR